MQYYIYIIYIIYVYNICILYMYIIYIKYVICSIAASVKLSLYHTPILLFWNVL